MSSVTAYRPDRGRAHRREGISKRWLLRAWIWALFLSMPFSREIGGLNFVLLSLISAIYILIERKYNKIPAAMYAVSIIGLFYILLSYSRLLPRAWTIFFDASAIPQQASFLVMVPTSFFIFREYLSESLSTKRGRMLLAYELFSVYVVTVITGLVIGGIGSVDIYRLFSIPALGNFAMLLVASASILIACTRNAGKNVVLIIFIAMSLMSTYAQNYVFAFYFAAAALFPARAYFGLVISVAAISVSYLWMSIHPELGYTIDQNLVVRLVFFQDAIDGLAQSGLVGVGFGTEGIRVFSSFFGREFMDPYSEQGNFINLAAHNSFATIGFRMGVVGLLALVWLMYEALRRCRVPGWKEEQARRCITLLAAFLVMFFNPALESPFYYYGVSLCLAAIWAGDDAVRTWAPVNVRAATG